MLTRLHHLPQETLGGLALLATAVLALLLVNAGGEDLYRLIVDAPLLGKTTQLWVNDALMALFFVLVGIEIRHEFSHGNLRTPRQALLPLVAAVGGVLAPVAVYLLLAGGTPAWHGGAAVPMATDIAFVLALVVMLGRRVPPALKAFVLALAVADDLMAIMVIAVAFTQHVLWAHLGLALGLAALLALKNRTRARLPWVYALVGLTMWLWVFKSGVHATLAGVLLGVMLPISGPKGQPRVAKVFEHTLMPWVRWLVLPLFAFVNMGVALGDAALLTHPVTLGVALGLLVGKQAGIFGTVWLMVRSGLASLPSHTNWRQLYGTACLCGIGFTMSLFLAALALPGDVQNAARLGILAGSVASAGIGIAVLMRGGKA